MLIKPPFYFIFFYLFFPYSISVPRDLPMFHTLLVLTNRFFGLKGHPPLALQPNGNPPQDGKPQTISYLL